MEHQTNLIRNADEKVMKCLLIKVTFRTRGKKITTHIELVLNLSQLIRLDNNVLFCFVSFILLF